MAERKGGKKIMGIALSTLSVSTFIIPFTCKLLGSSGLYALRFLSGMASVSNLKVLNVAFKNNRKTSCRRRMSNLRNVRRSKNLVHEMFNLWNVQFLQCY